MNSVEQDGEQDGGQDGGQDGVILPQIVVSPLPPTLETEPTEDVPPSQEDLELVLDTPPSTQAEAVTPSPSIKVANRPPKVLNLSGDTPPWCNPKHPMGVWLLFKGVRVG